MNLSNEAIDRFYATLIKIIEEKNNVKINYKLVTKKELADTSSNN